MSGKGKRKEEEEYDSDGSVDGHAPPKKVSKTDSSDDSDDIVVCEVGSNLNFYLIFFSPFKFRG